MLRRPKRSRIEVVAPKEEEKKVVYWILVHYCELGNEHSVSIICGKLLQWMGNC
jgi:hypothetical protein